MRGLPPGTASGAAGGGPALITLAPLDERALARLPDAAGADPLEVMPPVVGPPGWTSPRRAASLAFHRGRSLDPATASTTADNVGARSLLAGLGAMLTTDGDEVRAELPLR
ncbi:hypothetical protein [Amycolatopsis camponoti]|uniref:hypothetical protein n=1 Tax=Amycolatopsis camponoti TaxID=2606593 RepID=UPI0012D741BB|nr:hypothetical protein [Amycolatopsis camponoti]